MSQEKVDLRKEQKHNRKKILKKQKMEHILLSVGGVVVVAAIVIWAGFSAHTKYNEKKAETPTYYSVDTSNLTEYLASLQD